MSRTRRTLPTSRTGHRRLQAVRQERKAMLRFTDELQEAAREGITPSPRPRDYALLGDARDTMFLNEFGLIPTRAGEVGGFYYTDPVEKARRALREMREFQLAWQNGDR